MPKLIMIEPTIVNYGDDRGGVHEDAGNEVEVNIDTAATLAKIGRALYVRKEDDPTKGQHTASAELVKGARAEAARRAKAAKEAEEAEAARRPADPDKTAE
jgi:hypothetical protein